MAIFHLDFKIVKRSEGRSSVAKAAYHARCRITDERTGDTYDYSRRTDLCGHFILAPVNAPEHIVKDSTALWNEVERVERQNNGQTARYFDVAIPAELNNDDKKKLVLEYCQKNFVEKGMIADIAFHDLDSDNPHAHVMLTLKTIGSEGFGKKERSWNDRKMSVLWRESWASMANSYLTAAGSSERIDHRSLQVQHEEALEKAVVVLDNEEKALWLSKAAETNRPAMKRIHSARWRSKAAQEQRAKEQAFRDAAKQEAVEVYKTFSELDLEIVVDVRSFTVAVLAEPEEIILSDIHSRTSEGENHKSVLVAPAPHARTKLKKSSSSTARAVKRAPVKSKKKQVDSIFRRFTALVVNFFKEKFVWARKKPLPVSVDIEHDKRISENYVFDEVQGIYVPRTEHERRARFNTNDYKPTKDETSRFPSRPKSESQEPNNNIDLDPSIYARYKDKGSYPKMRPPK
ncbi:MobQ family relaxase [Citrobacter werkmanii]|uniref:MobQ family relaxase n=1 Tax=Citrobacter werkmanii TaxID=67827 RepID=UPI0026556CFD|nr:MobQ family relaxase [Citrobacter werkmanii]MDN8553960.1 MobQ family relaxase [Citrobacter werkmanii]